LQQQHLSSEIPCQLYHPNDMQSWIKFSKRNAIFIDPESTSPSKIIALYSPCPLLTELDKKARCLSRIENYNHPIERKAWKVTSEHPKRTMKGKMYGHGFRGGYEKGKSWGTYVQKPGVRGEQRRTEIEEWKQEMDMIVIEYFRQYRMLVPQLAIDLCLTALEYKTPLVAGTPVGNLTVTINGSTPAHTDNDAYREEGTEEIGAYAFGTWFNFHPNGEQEKSQVLGGDFFFPEYEIYLELSHGTSAIWCGRNTVHGTAELETIGDVFRIGTSIQLTQALANRCK